MAQGRDTRESIMRLVSSHLEQRRGVLLVGDIGVGKSFLARRVAEAHPTSHVEMLFGAPSVRQIPFGAASHLVPERTVSDPLWLLQLTRRSLEERAAGRELIVVVDDLDQVDSGTQALVHQLAAGRAASVIATARIECVSLPEIVPFWKDEHLVRIDVPPLTRAEHDELVADLVGAPTTAIQNERIWTLTQGNPLFLRELVLGGVIADEQFDVGSLTAELIKATRLRDVVGRRLGNLSSTERWIVDAIALAEPLDARVAASLFDDESLDAVKQRMLIVAETSDNGAVYRTWHPLLGELVRADMSASTRTALLRSLTTALLAEVPGPTTDLRAASWLVDGGIDVEPALATRAARQALRVFDGNVALRLSDAALAAGPSADCLVSRAEALSVLGRIDEAEAVFVEAEQFVADESVLGVITSLRAMNLMHRGGRADEAARLLFTRSREVTDPQARAMIESMLMQGEGLQGDFRRALELGPVLSREVRTGDIAELNVLVSLVVARTVTGRLEGVESEVARGVEIAQQLADEYPIEADQMLLNQLLFELTRPDVNRGLRLITERLSSSSGAGDGPWLYLAAWALSVAGDLDAACRAACTGLERLADVDPIGLRVLAAGAGAMAHAQSGDTDTAAEMIELVADDPRRSQPRSQMFLSRATTWLEARRGGTRSGAEHAARRGRFLDEAWHQTWGAWTAYDAVRLGHPELVVDDLERTASASGDGAVQLFARQARAYVDGDGATLADIANRFESVGARAHAAEAHAHAASVFSLPDVVGRHRLRSIVLASRCPGMASPVVDSIDAPLSAREQEIGVLAAAGRSSKEIADQLFVSPRTVDNHLGAAYSKLGLVGRAELAEWFIVTHSVVDDYSIVV